MVLVILALALSKLVILTFVILSLPAHVQLIITKQPLLALLVQP